MPSKRRSSSSEDDSSSDDSSDDSRKEPEPDWDCPRCTLANDAKSAKCNACEFRRPRQSLPSHAQPKNDKGSLKKKRLLSSEEDSSDSSSHDISRPAMTQTPQNMKRRNIIQSDSDDSPPASVPSRKLPRPQHPPSSNTQPKDETQDSVPLVVIKTETEKSSDHSNANGATDNNADIKKDHKDHQTERKLDGRLSESALISSGLANGVPRPASAASSASSMSHGKKLSLKERLALMQQAKAEPMSHGKKLSLKERLALMQQAKAEQLKRIRTPPVPELPANPEKTDNIPSINVDIAAKGTSLSTKEESSGITSTTENNTSATETEGTKPIPQTSPSKPSKSPSKLRNAPKKVKWDKYRPAHRPPKDALDLLGWTLLRENVYLETHPNGGAKIVHVFMNDLHRMDTNQRQAFATECIKEFLNETIECADYVMGIVHGGAQAMPNFLSYIADQYPNTSVVTEELGESGSHVVSIAEYYKNVCRTYDKGSHQGGQMRNISLVGTVQEENGGYFEDIIGVLERHDFTALSVPWGPMSVLKGETAGQSDDGPILWTRCGEQILRAGADGKRRGPADAVSFRSKAPREKVIHDRTNCHADFSGNIPDRYPVAAVGLLQSCDPDKNAAPIVCKRVVAFSAKDMELVQDLCGLDFNEEPMDQSDKSYWIDDARLNQLRRMGATYAQIELKTGDLYFIPRKICHQFHTVSACSSIAWHLRYETYQEFITIHQQGPSKT